MTITDDTSVERQDVPELIAALYRQALCDDALDTESDFFESGGDSLAAFQITAGLQDILGIEVPVALIFAYPSPLDLADVIAETVAAR